MLCTKPYSFHWPSTLSRPRSVKRLSALLKRTLPNTGSTVAKRCAINSFPRSLSTIALHALHRVLELLLDEDFAHEDLLGLAREPLDVMRVALLESIAGLAFIAATVLLDDLAHLRCASWRPDAEVRARAALGLDALLGSLTPSMANICRPISLPDRIP